MFACALFRFALSGKTFVVFVKNHLKTILFFKITNPFLFIAWECCLQLKHDAKHSHSSMKEREIVIFGLVIDKTKWF